MADKGSFLQDSDVKDFTRDIQQYNLGPLWEAIPEVMNKTPQSHAQAYLWSGELLKKKLSEAAEIFTPDRGGERRAIYFQNPGLTYRQPWGMYQQLKRFMQQCNYCNQEKKLLHIVIRKVHSDL